MSAGRDTRHWIVVAGIAFHLGHFFRVRVSLD
jgi:hypothetical protein